MLNHEERFVLSHKRDSWLSNSSGIWRDVLCEFKAIKVSQEIISFCIQAIACPQRRCGLQKWMWMNIPSDTMQCLQCFCPAVTASRKSCTEKSREGKLTKWEKSNCSRVPHVNFRNSTEISCTSMEMTLYCILINNCHFLIAFASIDYLSTLTHSTSSLAYLLHKLSVE